MILKKHFILAGLCLCVSIARSQPITDAQALEAGHALETAIGTGNSYVIDHFLYPDSLLERIRQKSKVLQDPDLLKGFKSTFVPTLSQGSISKQVLNATHNGSYRLLREYDKGGRKHLLFRMFGDGGLNYHDFILVRAGDSVKAADLYTYVSDEWVSSSVARITDMMIQGNDPLGDVSIIKKMSSQLGNAEYMNIKSSYEELRPELKKDKSIMSIYIAACHHIDLGLYQEALEQYASTFPDAPSSYLMMLDLYYLQKEYDKGIVCIDKLDRIIGGDTLLDYFRANFYLEMNKKTEAIACYERVYQYDPTFKINVLRLCASYAATGQNEKAKKVIAGYMQTPGYHLGDLNLLYDQYPDLK
jgi:tetratricopeptide (TPR) repeat protein